MSRRVSVRGSLRAQPMGSRLAYPARALNRRRRGTNEIVDDEFGREEHPLLGSPRRDLAGTIFLGCLTALLFVLLATPARASIQRLDETFLRQMVSIRSSPLTAVAKVLNVLGLVAITLPVRLLIAGVLAVRRRWWHLSAFASAVVLSEISIGSLKALYHRARPPGSLVSVSGGSFPSGHAVAASVTAVAAVIALFPEGPRRFWWGVVAAIFSLVMALSRAYLAAHWLSDAVAGVLLGTSFALIAAVVVHAIRSRAEAGSHPGPSSSPT
jgi:membrane-associated phospholipid phosphatase